MKKFSALFWELDKTNSTSEKLSLLRQYFETAPGEDAAWAVYYLTGRRLKRLVKSTDLRSWAAEIAGIPDWLFEECYETVGDLAETISLLLPRTTHSDTSNLSVFVADRVQTLGGLDNESQKDLVRLTWQSLTEEQCLVFNKLITGGFRVGVSHRLVTKGLSQASGLDPSVIAHRLMGDWQPSTEFFSSLFSPDTGDTVVSRPYPFLLAYPLEGQAEALGGIIDWQIEWKWDGIRCQLIRRSGKTYIWSRGEELISSKFPELIEASQELPDGTVLDGEILPWKGGKVLPFSELQRRIGRKKPGKKILKDVPVVLMVFDLLESGCRDVRKMPLTERRETLKALIRTMDNQRILVSPTIPAEAWQDLQALRETSRKRSVEGFMLKKLDSEYQVGRKKGLWWKWKADPFTIDAVLIYAQRGHGRRASLYSDYTFGIWKDGSLVPFAKAYSGLTDEEIRRVDRFVRTNTIERFGPVRSVRPELVFELAFEGIQRSTRHKAGIAVRFPRMNRWRSDKKASDAESIETALSLLESEV